MTLLDEEVQTTPHEERERLVNAARDLVPLLKEKAAQHEQDRDPSQEVIDALEEAGLFKILAPRRVGGSELDVRTLLEVAGELARGDGSAAWVTTLYNGGAFLTGLVDDAVQDEVYSRGAGRACGVLTPSSSTTRGEGGFLVSGAWAFATGSTYADWAFVAVPITDEHGNQVDQGMALISRDNFESRRSSTAKEPSTSLPRSITRGSHP